MNDQDIINYLKIGHATSIIYMYGECIILAHDTKDLENKKRLIDRGITYGFYIKDRIIDLIKTGEKENLTRAQAQIKLLEGNAISHDRFKDNGYVRLDSNNRLKNEKDTILDKQGFWIDRGGVEFDSGWFVYVPKI